MDGKRPRRASTPALIASSFLGQAGILAAIIALLLAAVHVSHSVSARSGGAVLLPFRTPLVPPYYAALTTTGAADRLGPFHITIRDTTSGAILATVAPPPGFATFSLVSGGTSEGEFLVAAQGWDLTQPDGPLSAAADAALVQLYTLRFDATAHVTTLTPLPVPEIPGGLVPVATLIWASPSGDAFVETETSARQPAGMTVITGGEPQDIPLSPQVAGVAW